MPKRKTTLSQLLNLRNVRNQYLDAGAGQLNLEAMPVEEAEEPQEQEVEQEVVEPKPWVLRNRVVPQPAVPGRRRRRRRAAGQPVQPGPEVPVVVEADEPAEEPWSFKCKWRVYQVEAPPRTP